MVLMLTNGQANVTVPVLTYSIADRRVPPARARQALRSLGARVTGAWLDGVSVEIELREDGALAVRAACPTLRPPGERSTVAAGRATSPGGSA